MSFLNKVFRESSNKDNTSSKINWIQLTELKQLDTIIEESVSTPAIIFKHSTRCSISRMALKQFEKEYSIDENKVKPYFLDLLNHRDISNEIASLFAVQHQSPQLLLIKSGKAIYHVSHNEIDAILLKDKL